jgi:hypothetical protein
MTDMLERRGIPYQVTGGVAAKLYGSQRDVNDIDLELPNERLAELVPDTAPYIVQGPERLKDGWWDVDILVLEYKGQLLDVCGLDDVRIFDTQAGRGWVEAPSDLSRAELHVICGKKVPVVARAMLADYKKLLFGDHQRQDVEAVLWLIGEEAS